MVYLFDAFVMGHTCISYGLDRIFSSSTILKVSVQIAMYRGDIVSAVICKLLKGSNAQGQRLVLQSHHLIFVACFTSDQVE